MVLKYSLLTARVRLSGCRRDCAADRRFKFNKRGQFFIRVHNEALTVAAMSVSNARFFAQTVVQTLSR
jgi:hypothetical protein